MKTLCLFDLDGTLTDSKPGIINAATYALKAAGIKSSEYIGTLESLIGPPIRDAMRLIHPFSDAEVEEVVRKYRKYYVEKGMLENAVYPGILELLAKLQNEGITMAIATSKTQAFAKRIAEHFDFAKYFSVIMGAEPDGTRDRKSELITAVLEYLGGKENFQSIIMIGDREYDIIGAQETGIDSIGVTWGYGSVQEFEAAGAKTVVTSVSQLYDEIIKKSGL
ncbi:MAG: HAD hydrolase-like protein [Defluviitaleaceae bacterium]|nr:HAD hydrolase-like protein [Defluviitaleaceae bacterium]